MATEKREIELTDYEFRRLQELTKASTEAETRLQQLITLMRALTESQRELQGRKAELLELLSNKYQFSLTAKFTFNEGKIILEGDNKNNMG